MEPWLEDFRQTIEQSAQRLMLLSEDQSRLQATVDKWSPKEIMGHLIDSASNNHQRFVRSQFSNDLVCEGYQQADWVRAQHYLDESWPQLVQLWRHYNLHL